MNKAILPFGKNYHRKIIDVTFRINKEYTEWLKKSRFEYVIEPHGTSQVCIVFRDDVECSLFKLAFDIDG